MSAVSTKPISAIKAEGDISNFALWSTSLLVFASRSVRAASDDRPLLSIGLTPSQEFLTFHVLPRMSTAVLQARLSRKGLIRDAIPGIVEQADVEAMFRCTDYHREMSEVFYTNEELLGAQVASQGSNDGSSVSLENVNPAAEVKAIDALHTHLRYPESPSAAPLYSPVLTLDSGGPCLLSFDLKVIRPNLVVSVNDDQERRTIFQVSYSHSQPFLREDPLLDAGRSPKIQLIIWSNNQKPARTELERCANCKSKLDEKGL